MRLPLLLVLAGLAILPDAEGGLVNLSARGVAGTGADALTAGFVLTGSGPKRVLVRAAGPGPPRARRCS